MKRALSAALATALATMPGIPAGAEDFSFGSGVQAMGYVQVPFGGDGRREIRPQLGLRVDRGAKAALPGTRAPEPRPLVDFSLSRGNQSLLMQGVPVLAAKGSLEESLESLMPWCSSTEDKIAGIPCGAWVMTGVLVLVGGSLGIACAAGANFCKHEHSSTVVGTPGGSPGGGTSPGL